MKRSVLDIMNKLQGCQRAGCVSGQRPVKIPVVVVWAGPRKDHDPANFILESERTCASCVARLTLAEVMPRPAQEQLAASFRKDGKPAPLWSTAELHWRPAPRLSRSNA